jgi:hypothetical protein
MLLLWALFVWVIVLGPIGLHWLQGMAFWASLLPGCSGLWQDEKLISDTVLSVVFRGLGVIKIRFWEVRLEEHKGLF